MCVCVCVCVCVRARAREKRSGDTLIATSRNIGNRTLESGLEVLPSLSPPLGRRRVPHWTHRGNDGFRTLQTPRPLTAADAKGCQQPTLPAGSGGAAQNPMGLEATEARARQRELRDPLLNSWAALRNQEEFSKICAAMVRATGRSSTPSTPPARSCSMKADIACSMKRGRLFDEAGLGRQDPAGQLAGVAVGGVPAWATRPVDRGGGLPQRNVPVLLRLRYAFAASLELVVARRDPAGGYHSMTLCSATATGSSTARSRWRGPQSSSGWSTNTTSHGRRPS